MVYTFAARALTEEHKKAVDEQTESFEKQADGDGVRDHYLNWLHEKLNQ